MTEMPGNITAREQDIIELLAQGLTNPAIADELYIATGTVKWYVKHLNQKLHTSSRQEIVEAARELGLLDDAGELTQCLAHQTRL